MMPASFEAAAKLPIVIDLAVVDDPFRLVRVVDRLLAAGEIDDREPAHRKADAAIQIEAIFVGTSMLDGEVHRLKDLTIDGLLRSTYYPYNATHYGYPL